MALSMRLASAVCVLIWLGIGGRGVLSSEGDHRYMVGDPVPLYAAIVSPFHNSWETYHYFDLPFCFSENATDRKETLGEILKGGYLVDTPYKLHFRVDQNTKLLCKKKLTKKDVAQFRSVIGKDYYFQMFFDDLPLWGFIGQYEWKWETGPRMGKYFLFRRIHFEIFYIDDHVVEINCHTGYNEREDVTEDRESEVEFLYSVAWKKATTPFENRMEKYMSSVWLRHQQFQWFSTMNSCVIVLLLTGLLATILMRVLKNDLIKYTSIVTDDQDEAGWKCICGDVFRFPVNKSLFAACVGSGTQLLALTVLTCIPALLGVFQPYKRGSPLAALLLIYTLTSVIAGYTSTSFYSQLEGTYWVSNVLLTGFIFSGPLVLTYCFLNTVAVAYGARAALPLATIVIIVLIWISVTISLIFLGGIAGRNRSIEFQAPCDTTKCAREIPVLTWYRRTLPQMTIAGFLPFGAIHVELFHIFSSLWGHKVYTVYIVFFAVFIVLVIVAAFVTVALTYFQLCAEDHQWWWRSLFCGGSTALYMFGFCFYYYFHRSAMSGFMQTSIFFGCMACACYGFFLMLGTVGFYTSLLFVRYIYGSIKCD